ncbi:hypothetical protein K431DRAFT_126113 [Polychaeton citri CBS 116435]|uniref:Uncharacterized protein n=1 Tax=Polychaeton citri CBS 116435 TaxID=1314669 RepID=A0A9P4Q673_9PEZI|nr:hypothetical protein K431DRAFT_126113 [Polychaeton citri CBS 116435]
MSPSRQQQQQGLPTSPSYRNRASSNRVRGLDPQDVFIARNFYQANSPLISQQQQQQPPPQQQHGQPVRRQDTASSDGSSSDESVASSARNSHYIASENRQDNWQSLLNDSNDDRSGRTVSRSISKWTRKLRGTSS